MTVGYSIMVRVYYEDTDAGGVVYYANYLRFMERARTEWLRALGFGQDELAQQPGVIFAVRTAQVEYLRPARLDDLLDVAVRLERRGQASLDMRHEIHKSDVLLCRGAVKLACLDARSFAPRPIPESILTELDKWKKS